MLFCTIVTTSDPLGKVSIASLTEQARMELLIENFFYKDPFQSPEGDFVDISEWPHVKTDADGSVTHIDWTYDYNGDDYMTGGRTIQLQYLLEKLEEFHINYRSLLGTVSTHDLPRHLKWFAISSNVFSGEFVVAGLPSSMVGVQIQNNHFEGSLSIPDLPPKMEDLLADNNRFWGTIDLAKLPDTMRVLTLHDNAFVQDGLCIGDIPPQCAITIEVDQFGKVSTTGDRDLEMTRVYNFLTIKLSA